MNDLKQAITSMEVAEMVGKPHNELLKDMRRYADQLGAVNIPQSDFFRESTYTNSQNKELPCYNVTKKGCEFIGNKLTGIKGTEFTAKYINRFHDMEEQIAMPRCIVKTYDTKATSLGELANYTKEMGRRMEKQNSEPYKIAEAFKMVSEQFGIKLPEDFVKAPKRGRMTFIYSEEYNFQ